MAEIKHTFQKGRMNKDLDERLVPQGEYRDALNIEVATSDDDDAGTVQNLYGNIELSEHFNSDLVNPTISWEGEASYFVGSIADEQANSSYFFLKSPELDSFSSRISYNINKSEEDSDPQPTLRTNPISTQGSMLYDNYNDDGGAVESDLSITCNCYCAGISSNRIKCSGGGYGMYAAWDCDLCCDRFCSYEKTENIDDKTINDGNVTYTIESVSVNPYTTKKQIEDLNANRFDEEGNPVVGKELLCKCTCAGQAWQSNIKCTGLLAMDCVTCCDAYCSNKETEVGGEINDKYIYSQQSDGNSGTSEEVRRTNISSITTLESLQKSVDEGEILNETKYWKDMIIKYDSHDNKVKPVLTDIYRIEVSLEDFEPEGDKDSLEDQPGGNLTSYDRLEVNSNFVQHIRPGMSIRIQNVSGNNLMFSYYDGEDYPLNNMSNQITIRQVDGNFIYFDRMVIGSLSSAFKITLQADKVLNFNGDYITGINIINDLLFWTDNSSEPKKINLTRCAGGKNSPYTPSFNVHSKLLLNDPNNSVIGSLGLLDNIDIGSDSSLKEEHITVIRKSPKTAPVIDMTVRSDGFKDIAYTATCTFNFIDPSTSNLYLLDNLVELTDSDNNSAILSGKKFKQSDVLEFISISDSSLRVVASVQNPSVPRVRIKEIDPLISSSDTSWNVKVVEKNPLFETKFGRFAYRYKYQDGEYSTFSPFSELAFIPGKFDYIPKKGYNLGMLNNIRSLKIKDFIVDDFQRPDDVVEVDILFKDTTSPNVYVVKSIKRGFDPEWNESTSGKLNSGIIDINTEMIHRTLPSSQILRSWDNVPLRALAQEVTGNRIVYGNYTQNYNLQNPVVVVPNLLDVSHPGSPDKETVESYQSRLLPFKSIKSDRTYKIGVVFGDEYGRETPVTGIGGIYSANLNVPSGFVPQQTIIPDSVSVPKENAGKINKLVASLEWGKYSIPDWADYYKYYVKETSNEYYNLVMDRWYEAEDGNIWISFQSADRNKLDEESYIVLKNQHGNENPVKDNARYKILAIKNEAPSFIKTVDKVLSEFDIIDENLATTQVIDLNETEFNNSGLGEYVFEGVGFARIVGELNNVMRRSDWVRISHINSTAKTIHLVETFDGSGDMNSALAFGVSAGAAVRLEIKDSVVENKPEFEGKFFVKIFNDAVVSNNILETSSSGYAVRATNTLKYISTKDLDSDGNTTNPASDTANYLGDFDNASGADLIDGEVSASNFSATDWADTEVTDGSNLAKVDFFSETAKFYKNTIQVGSWFIDEARVAIANGSDNTITKGLHSNPDLDISNMNSITLSVLNNSVN